MFWFWFSCLSRYLNHCNNWAPRTINEMWLWSFIVVVFSELRGTPPRFCLESSVFKGTVPNTTILILKISIRGTEKLSDLPEITQKVGGSARMWTQIWASVQHSIHKTTLEYRPVICKQKQSTQIPAIFTELKFSFPFGWISSHCSYSITPITGLSHAEIAIYKLYQ